MRLYEIKVRGSFQQWIDLDSVTQVRFETFTGPPHIPGPNLTLTLGQAVIDVINPIEIKEIALILGITIP